MDQPGALLERRVRSWRRQSLRRSWLDGLARLACAGVLLLAGSIWLDQAATLPQKLRLAGLALAAAAAAFAAVRWLGRPLWTLRWGGVLDEAASLHPGLGPYLRSSWELLGGCPPGTSESLRLAHLRETEKRLEAVPASAAISWRPGAGLRKAAAAAAAAALSLAWAPAGAFTRVLAPWRDLPLERLVSVAPGDAAVEWGRSATISARWLPEAGTGLSRHELALWLKPEGGSWRKSAWDKAAGEERRFTADELTSPLRYRLSWRDLQSREYLLTPVLAPALESVRARVHGAETGPAALTPAEPLTALRGSLVTISGLPNQPLARAALRLSTLPQPLTLRAAASGELEASFVVQEDAVLRFELETADGRSSADGPSYQLKAAADAAPVVELVSPLEPVLASPADKLPIAYGAKDDGGLARLSLLLKPEGKPAREVPLPRPSGREASGDYLLELAGLPLGRVKFQLKAVDNGSPPQAGFSVEGLIDLQDLQARHAKTQEVWGQAEKSLEAASRAADKLGAELSQGRPVSEADSDALARDWGRAAADLQKLSEAMAQDPYANPGMANETKSAADGLSQAQKTELPAARQAAQAGASPEAARRHERLARRAEQARKLLRQGKTLQGMQDFYEQTGRAAQTGAELESGMEALARGAKGSPEQLKKLGAELARIQRQMEELQKALDSLPKADAAHDAAKSVEMPVDAAREAADAAARAMAAGDYAEAARQARKLSEALAKIQQAVGQAAATAAGQTLPPAARQRVEKAQRDWSKLVEDQGKLLERTQKLEETRVSGRVEDQRRLLAELAQRQRLAVSSAAAQASFPQDALHLMRGAQSEFDARKLQQAPMLLRSAAYRARQSGFDGLAREEADIADAISEASAPSSAPAPGPESEQAAKEQAGLTRESGRLKSELESLEAETGGSAAEALDALSGAQSEQAAAAKSLGARDSAGALPRQQKALDLLTKGSSQMSQSGSGEGQRRQELMQPFSRPAGVVRIMRGGGPGSGAQMGFVPLPSERDYVPPRELREELERSLRESRPAGQDALIKEYFKRISQ